MACFVFSSGKTFTETIVFMTCFSRQDIYKNNCVHDMFCLAFSFLFFIYFIFFALSIQSHFDTTYRVTARSSLVVAQSNTDFHFNTHWRGDNKTQHAQEKEGDASANSRPCKDGKLANFMPHPLGLPHCIPKIANATAALLGNNGEHFERHRKCHNCSSFWSYCIGCRSSGLPLVKNRLFLHFFSMTVLLG